MLNGSLYKINTCEDIDDQIEAELTLDQNHPIFEGHFPGQPVLPGVCLLEILKDLLNTYNDTEYVLRDGSNIKYMKMVDPRQSPELTFKINQKAEDDSLQVSATSYMTNGEANFKFKGLFVKE
ncbi:3-hydroxyacyl-ACP dehydratase [Fulvivirga sediminis]|uniref:3-hydroxyacyl-ACP dehydratase n=1 Tax=Fulvivirga sediminis TaxID=2803949 RepID=A0A937K0X1_9BACT|nr:3-hydroxyacyl-ACP dehydratase [Fulvivirga sediminis]MBL3656831.1 3-hydroxyacyl-ACP dehydratase [Fulvivirga sediminis]